MTNEPTTLRELGGEPAGPSPLGASALVLIDCQNTYTRGVLELDGVQAALDEVEQLLARSRDAGIPIIHVVHDDGPGSLYDLEGESGQVVPRVAPRDGEPVVVKNYPNAFTQTTLHDTLQAAAADRPLVIAGFMTHMCINSTARGAFSLGYTPAVVAAATATRALPGIGSGPAVPADILQAASLAGLADVFAAVVGSATDLAD